MKSKHALLCITVSKMHNLPPAQAVQRLTPKKRSLFGAILPTSIYIHTYVSVCVCVYINFLLLASFCYIYRRKPACKLEIISLSIWLCRKCNMMWKWWSSGTGFGGADFNHIGLASSLSTRLSFRNCLSRPCPALIPPSLFSSLLLLPLARPPQF